jgi:hypothetical protein
MSREAEYMELYREMQVQAAAQAASATPGSAPAPSVPSPEAFVAALKAAEADDPEADEADDPEDARRSFVWPGMALTPSTLLSFRLPAWLPLLRKHTMPTRLLPLPPDFVEYLLEDGVWMPEDLAPVQADSFADRDNEYDTEADRREEAQRWTATLEEIDSEDEAEEAAEEAAAAKQKLRQSQPFFPELVAQLQSLLAELNGPESSKIGGVFPSMDWHAPTDAAWIATERVAKCHSVGDVLLLLKSSDKVQTELTEPFANCSSEEAPHNAAAGASAAAASSAGAVATAASSSSSAAAPSFTPTLCLRKWSALHPSRLFRTFIYRGCVLAISQLDVANYYAHLQSAEARDAVQDAIEGWLEDESICETLAAHLSSQQSPANDDSTGHLHCVLDVYLDNKERVWLVKLKPFWPRTTDPLLFTWQELYHLAQAHDHAEEERARRIAEFRAAREDGSAAAQLAATAAAPAGSLSMPSSWPSDDSLRVPFRVVTNSGAGLDVLRAVSNLAAQFPSDGIDVSDKDAIERWVQRIERDDLVEKKH